MKLQERLNVLQNLLDSKSKELANLDIIRQTKINEFLELKGKIDLLNELIKEKGSEVKEEDTKFEKKSLQTPSEVIK